MFWNGKIYKNILLHFCKGIRSRKNFYIFPDFFMKYWNKSIFPLEQKFFSFIKTYVFDHSASFDMHIEKLEEEKNYFFFQKFAHNVTDWSVTNMFSFKPSLMEKDVFKYFKNEKSKYFSLLKYWEKQNKTNKSEILSNKYGIS